MHKTYQVSGTVARTRYYRKRKGYRDYIAALWSRLRLLMVANPTEEATLEQLHIEGLTAEETATLVVIFNDFGRALKEQLGRIPEEPPDFFLLGSEMPASRFRRDSLLVHYLKPKGRSRKPARKPNRPTQPVVDEWMLVRAKAAFERNEPALKEEAAVKECMMTINASRQQARVAFSRLPSELRRRRGQHDRWVEVRAAKPSL